MFIREFIQGKYRYRIVSEASLVKVTRCIESNRPFVREETATPGFTSMGIQWVFITETNLTSVHFTSVDEAETFIKEQV